MIGGFLTWTWWDTFTLVLAVAVTIYVIAARNPHPPGSDNHKALRFCRTGLALSLWSIGFGLIGMAFAIAAFVLGLLGIIKGRTIFGIGVIVLSVVGPVSGCLAPLVKITAS